jgi:hypothetical protein
MMGVAMAPHLTRHKTTGPRRTVLNLTSGSWDQGTIVTGEAR